MEKKKELASNIVYFRQERWRLTEFTWCEDIEKEFPDIRRAYQDMKYYKKILNTLIEELNESF